MHRISIFGKGALLLMLPMFLFLACNKRLNNDKSSATGDDAGDGYAADASRIEWINDDVISLSDAAGALYNSAYMRTAQTTLGTCATVGVDTVTIPHRLTIYFGDKNVTCLDNNSRRGKIIISYNGHYADTQQLHTITYENYYINNNQLKGYVKVTKVDTTVTGNWFYNVTVNDSLEMDQLPQKSTYVVWSGNLTRRWVSGKLTNDRSDDVFSISGSANLTRPNAHQYTFNIATPLQVALGCDFIESGVVNVAGYTGNRIINYGDGTCDAAAKITDDIYVWPITMVK